MATISVEAEQGFWWSSPAASLADAEPLLEATAADANRATAAALPPSTDLVEAALTQHVVDCIQRHALELQQLMELLPPQASHGGSHSHSNSSHSHASELQVRQQWRESAVVRALVQPDLLGSFAGQLRAAIESAFVLLKKRKKEDAEDEEGSAKVKKEEEEGEEAQLRQTLLEANDKNKKDSVFLHQMCQLQKQVYHSFFSALCRGIMKGIYELAVDTNSSHQENTNSTFDREVCVGRLLDCVWTQLLFSSLVGVQAHSPLEDGLLTPLRAILLAGEDGGSVGRRVITSAFFFYYAHTFLFDELFQGETQEQPQTQQHESSQEEEEKEDAGRLLAQLAKSNFTITPTTFNTVFILYTSQARRYASCGMQQQPQAQQKEEEEKQTQEVEAFVKEVVDPSAERESYKGEVVLAQLRSVIETSGAGDVDAETREKEKARRHAALWQAARYMGFSADILFALLDGMAQFKMRSMNSDEAMLAHLIATEERLRAEAAAAAAAAVPAADVKEGHPAPASQSLARVALGKLDSGANHFMGSFFFYHVCVGIAITDAEAAAWFLRCVLPSEGTEKCDTAAAASSVVCHRVCGAVQIAAALHQLVETLRHAQSPAEEAAQEDEAFIGQVQGELDHWRRLLHRVEKRLVRMGTLLLAQAPSTCLLLSRFICDVAKLFAPVADGRPRTEKETQELSSGGIAQCLQWQQDEIASEHSAPRAGGRAPQRCVSFGLLSLLQVQHHADRLLRSQPPQHCRAWSAAAEEGAREGDGRKRGREEEPEDAGQTDSPPVEGVLSSFYKAHAGDSAAQQLVLLGCSLLAQPVATLRDLLERALPTAALIHRGGYDQEMVSDQAQESTQRAQGYKETAVAAGEADLVALTFFPLYYRLFCALDAALHYILDLQQQQQQQRGEGHRRALVCYYAAALQEALRQMDSTAALASVSSARGHRSAGHLALGELYMFFAFAGSATPLFPPSALAFLREVLPSFFAMDLTAQPPQHNDFLHYWRALLQEPLPSDKRANARELLRCSLCSSFFLPPLRALGLDRSATTGASEVAIGLRYPVSAVVTYLRELPRGYFLRAGTHLSQRAGEDALAFLHSLLATEHQEVLLEVLRPIGRCFLRQLVELLVAPPAPPVQGRSSQQQTDSLSPHLVLQQDVVHTFFDAMLRFLKTATTSTTTTSRAQDDGNGNHPHEDEMVARQKQWVLAHLEADLQQHLAEAAAAHPSLVKYVPALEAYLALPSSLLEKKEQQGAKKAASQWSQWFWQTDYEQLSDAPSVCAKMLLRDSNKHYMRYIPTPTLLACRGALEKHAAVLQEEAEARQAALEAAVTADMQAILQRLQEQQQQQQQPSACAAEGEKKKEDEGKDEQQHGAEARVLASSSSSNSSSLPILLRDYIDQILYHLLLRAAISPVDAAAAAHSLVLLLPQLHTHLLRQVGPGGAAAAAAPLIKVYADATRRFLFQATRRLTDSTPLVCLSTSVLLHGLIERLILPYRKHFLSSHAASASRPSVPGVPDGFWQQRQQQQQRELLAALPAEEREANSFLTLLLTDLAPVVQRFLGQCTFLGDRRAYHVVSHATAILGLVARTREQLLQAQQQRRLVLQRAGATSVWLAALLALDLPLLEGMAAPAVSVELLFARPPPPPSAVPADTGAAGRTSSRRSRGGRRERERREKQEQQQRQLADQAGARHQEHTTTSANSAGHTSSKRSRDDAEERRMGHQRRDEGGRSDNPHRSSSTTRGGGGGGDGRRRSSRGGRKRRH